LPNFKIGLTEIFQKQTGRIIAPFWVLECIQPGIGTQALL